MGLDRHARRAASVLTREAQRTADQKGALAALPDVVDALDRDHKRLLRNVGRRFGVQPVATQRAPEQVVMTVEHLLQALSFM